MAEMEPAEQRVTADLSGYVEPIDAAVPATQELADAAQELNGTLAELGGAADDAGGSAQALAEAAGSARDRIAEAGAASGDAAGQVDVLTGSQDAAAGSAETLAEAMARFRDITYETNPGIDDQTASLLIEAAAMQALGLSAEETAGTINRTEDYEALRNALFDLSAGEAILVGRNGDLTVSFAAAGGSAADTAASLDVVAASGDTAAASLAADSAAADTATASFAAMPAVIGVAVVAALGPVGALATSVLSIGAAAALVLPDIKEVMKDLSGTGKHVPTSGPVAEAVAGLRQLDAVWKQIGADSGLQGSFLSELPKVASTVEEFLFAITPLARAGATSIDEIVAALHRTADSPQFGQFVQTIATYAPGATEALIHLAGAVGGDLANVLEQLAPQVAADTNAIAGLAGELGGPLGTAVAVAAAGLHGLIEGFQPVQDLAKALLSPVAGLVGGFGNLAHMAEFVGRGLGILLGGPLAAAAAGGEAVYHHFHSAAGGARDLGHSATVMGGDMSVAAAQTMDLASQIANLNSEFAKALTPQLNLDQAAITYGNDLATLKGDLAKSGDAIGLNTAAQRVSYGAYVTTVQGVLALVDAQEKAGGSASVMRGELRNAIADLDATGVHGADAAKLVGELRTALADIPGNVYSTIHINQVGNVPVATGGSGGSGGGGGVHIQPGPQAVPGPVPSMVPSLLGGASGGAQAPQVNITVPVTVSAGAGALTSPQFLQGLAPVIEEAVLRYAHLNQSSGLHFGGFTRGI